MQSKICLIYNELKSFWLTWQWMFASKCEVLKMCDTNDWLWKGKLAFSDCIDKLAVKNLPNFSWNKKVFGLLYHECLLLRVERKRCEADKVANNWLWWCNLSFLNLRSKIYLIYYELEKAFGLLDNECSLLSVESKTCETAADDLANDWLWWCKLPFLGPHKQTYGQKSA